MSDNFSSFESAFAPDAGVAYPVGRNTGEEAAKVFGQRIDSYAEFLSNAACPSYDGGIVRFFLTNTTPSLAQWNSDAGLFSGWPQAKSFFRAFAFDWQGNQIGFDRRFMERGEPLISQLEIGTGKVLKIPATFSELLNREMIINREALLGASTFRQWSERRTGSLTFHRCVGYRQPLFLNGMDILENMEEMDLDVYVTLTGQWFGRSNAKR